MTTKIKAGRLVLTLTPNKGGIVIRSLHDTGTGTEFLAEPPLPLFTLTLREISTRRELQLTADEGWETSELQPTPDGAKLIFENPSESAAQGLRVAVQVASDTKNDAFRWNLSVLNEGENLSLMRVVFPEAMIAELGEDGSVFLPRAAGEVTRGMWQTEFEHERLYPDPWMTMQYMAAYTGNGSAGLYFATHDPMGGPKLMSCRSHPEERKVHFRFDQPVANMTRPGNKFELTGEVVWRFFQGDWFDAAEIYRDWVRAEARWFPELTVDGRADTPGWARDVSIWCRAFGDGEVVPDVLEFAKYIGLPVGLHWYAWHNLPPGCKNSAFDNDMPNFFPPRQGFAEGVIKLREAGVYVMPYINARIWDTRDRGLEDWQFSRVALPATTKKEDGSPHTVVYGEETDGSDMTFAVMCPHTQLWQSKMLEICNRLFQEYKVNGIYLDQVSAMSPILCMDETHGHELGGGHWWNQGYWKMHDTIRDVMPGDVMLTSECNAEPFIRWFDGYLVWHWQRPNIVPAFVVVYGPSIQLFGRQYAGGPDIDLAARMRCAQQLVFGEQIGWMGADWVHESPSMPFIRHVVHTRWQLRRFFSAGEICRPPEFESEIPAVTADWQWYGEMNVTNHAVFAGAWRLPRENKAALIFVNVSDEGVTADFRFDSRALGVEGGRIALAKISGENRESPVTAPPSFTRRLEFPARTAWAWEISTP